MNVAWPRGIAFSDSPPKSWPMKEPPSGNRHSFQFDSSRRGRTGHPEGEAAPPSAFTNRNEVAPTPATNLPPGQLNCSVWCSLPNDVFAARVPAAGEFFAARLRPVGFESGVDHRDPRQGLGAFGEHQRERRPAGFPRERDVVRAADEVIGLRVGCVRAVAAAAGEADLQCRDGRPFAFAFAFAFRGGDRRAAQCQGGARQRHPADASHASDPGPLHRREPAFPGLRR